MRKLLDIWDYDTNIDKKWASLYIILLIYGIKQTQSHKQCNFLSHDIDMKQETIVNCELFYMCLSTVKTKKLEKNLMIKIYKKIES